MEFCTSRAWSFQLKGPNNFKTQTAYKRRMFWGLWKAHKQHTFFSHFLTNLPQLIHSASPSWWWSLSLITLAAQGEGIPRSMNNLVIQLGETLQHIRTITSNNSFLFWKLTSQSFQLETFWKASKGVTTFLPLSWHRLHTFWDTVYYAPSASLGPKTQTYQSTHLLFFPPKQEYESTGWSWSLLAGLFSSQLKEQFPWKLSQHFCNPERGSSAAWGH